MQAASHWIEKFGLQAHPEGGYFAETHRSRLEIPGSVWPDIYDGPRTTCTSIYFLVEEGNPSKLHRLRTEELWHFYAGDPIEILGWDAEGNAFQLVLGPNHGFQALVPAGAWFGARVMQGGSYALCGCTMAPGFDFADFELGGREALLADFPQHQELIMALT
jgi:hypothetical protein